MTQLLTWRVWWPAAPESSAASRETALTVRAPSAWRAAEEFARQWDRRHHPGIAEQSGPVYVVVAKAESGEGVVFSVRGRLARVYNAKRAEGGQESV